MIGVGVREIPIIKIREFKRRLYGAMQIPRLPVPLFAADRIADLRLKGIYPTSILMRDRQPWL